MRTINKLVILTQIFFGINAYSKKALFNMYDEAKNRKIIYEEGIETDILKGEIGEDVIANRLTIIKPKEIIELYDLKNRAPLGEKAEIEVVRIKDLYSKRKIIKIRDDILVYRSLADNNNYYYTIKEVSEKRTPTEKGIDELIEKYDSTYNSIRDEINLLLSLEEQLKEELKHKQ